MGVIVEMELPDWIKRNPAIEGRKPQAGRVDERFLDKTLHHLVSFTEDTLFNERIPQKDGLLQRIDPRFKMACLVGLIVFLSFQKTLEGIALLLLSAFLMAFASKVPIALFLKRLMPALGFTALIALPATLSVIVKGEPLFTLYALEKPHALGFIEIPRVISLTREGSFSALMLILRVTGSVSMILLITLTTHPAKLIKAVVYFMPGALKSISSIGYRYIFFLLRKIEQFILGFKSRSFSPTKASGKQRWVASRIGLLFSISLKLSRDLEKVMESRGYRFTTQSSRPEVHYPQFTKIYGSNGMNVFELEKVSYRYKDGNQAIENISFHVREGESISIIGANGSGKSTLLFLLDGLIQPESGSLKIFGEPVKNGFSQELRRRISFFFQSSQAQLFSLSVLDELSFGPSQLGLPKDEIAKRVSEILKFLKIGDLVDKCPWNLSEGEMKKVALGACLSINPDVLLLDEPTNGLDPRSQVDLIELIEKLRESGKVIMTVTHDLSIIEDISDRTIVLGENHQILTEGEPHEILKDTETLLAANLIHRHLHKHSWYIHEHSHYAEHEHLSEIE